MRHSYIVSYDICDPKRLRRMHKKMLGFGDRLQLSVFKCDLNDRERVLLEGAVLEIMNQKEDLLMIVDLGPSDSNTRLNFFGKRLPSSDRSAVIV
ncbi:MAG: CRISPR-associated endonuclease Cas2 [Firmicutes bacterium]|nr:CRISPR-associated endonuclease Cas2 [Bacillota bacterium]